jgi:hypothetical protein
MKWKEAMLAYLRNYPGSGLEELRKTTNPSVRIAGLRAEISTRDLQNRNE